MRPGTYPPQDFPAHVHAAIKGPNGINEYYIDDFIFDDERLLAADYCDRNIVPGMNIPGYPARTRDGVDARWRRQRQRPACRNMDCPTVSRPVRMTVP